MTAQHVLQGWHVTAKYSFEKNYPNPLMVACGYNHVLTRLACYTEKNRPSLDGIVDYETLQRNVYRENNLLIMSRRFNETSPGK